ncbi:HipA domain-containing protein [Candidatus Poriferisocius sp.]|uniref:HipA domain-containing protein n=1 Tax=Candidatus Poriferisocius sp. TaxID=3101276 RepID=UPI003B5B0012
MDELFVLMGGESAGILRRDRGVISLDYDLDYLEHQESTPLSTSMSLDSRHHSGEHVAAWLDGLLPDDDRVRFLWASEFGVNEYSPFDLLSTKIGHDCAGAVQFCRPEELDALTARGGSQHPVTEDDIAGHLRVLAGDSAQWHRRGVVGGRFSLGGAQAKFALHRDESGRWWQPEGDAPTTHIFKPSIRGLPDQALVEHLTMETAHHLGLPVARTRIAEFDGHQAIIVERYDRRRSDRGVRRLHQEDMCQALGLRPRLKYQRTGGPSPFQIADHLWDWATDADLDVGRFVDALFYNWLIVGPDAHAKNYSIRLEPDGVALAPLYDVCSFLPWLVDEEATDRQPLSMSVGRGYSVGDAAHVTVWEAAAEQMDLEPGDLVERAVQMAEDLEAAMHAAVDGLPAEYRGKPVVGELVDWGVSRSARCWEIFVGG